MGQVFKGRRKRSHFSSTDSKVSPNIVSHPGGSTHQAAAVTRDTKVYAGCIFFFFSRDIYYLLADFAPLKNFKKHKSKKI